MNRLRELLASLLLLALIGSARAEDEKAVPASDDGAYETDRPGEIENPFTVPAGSFELVDYIVAANGAAREDVFGGEGSAVFMDTALRLGLAPRVEAVISVDSFFSESSRQGSRPESGFGYTTLAAKWNFLKDSGGDYGLGLAPFVRLPITGSIGGTARAALGIIAPFDFDLEGGWELQGSTGVARSSDGSGDRSTDWENQVSLDRTLTKALAAYLELQVESGEGRATYATEFGVNWKIGPRVLADLGFSLGLDGNHARMSYVGLGWRF